MDEGDSTGPLRICTKCLIGKPHSEFHKASKTVIGLTAICKACSRAYYLANKEKIVAATLVNWHKRQAPKNEARAAAKLAKLAATDKRCAHCKEVKAKSEFSVSSIRTDGRHVYCKPCANLKERSRVGGDPAKRNKKSQAWQKNNPAKARAKYRKWYATGKGLEYARKWIAANKERARETARKRRSLPSNRIHHAIRSRLQQTLLNKGGKRTVEILGYTIDELKRHLERQFLPGMTWDNYGTWHVDHVLALSSFKVDDVNHPDVKRAWGLPNLRPLWAKDNLRKGAKRMFLL